MQPKTELIFENKKLPQGKKFNIIHFNDVYNVESAPNGLGGSSRFISLVEHIKRQKPTLVLFSGDAFSPSTLSMLLKGKQMAEILNLCQVDLACIGNHDFDFGVETMQNLMKITKFPWLLSNVFDADTMQPLAGALKKHIIEIEGIKIGFIGIVEEEWMATLSTIDFDDIKYESFILAGKRLAMEMKKKDKVNYVIALTHMRVPNDELFVNSVPEIDLFLGGHDHDYYAKQLNGKWLLKSGTDFRECTIIEMNVSGKKVNVSKVEKFIVDSSIPEKPEVNQIINGYLEELNKSLDINLGETNADLDGRFSMVRSQETNLGNFICDIILEAVDTDGFIMNSGSLRSNQIHPKGEFKVRDLKSILPYPTGIKVLELTGKQLYEALEIGVSGYPKLEGRFPQVSGIRFKFDPSKPVGKRIDPQHITVEEQPLEFDKTYRIGTTSYLADGKDGYLLFKSCPVLVEDEYLPLMFTVVENHFKAIKTLKEDPKCHLRQSLAPLCVVKNIIKEIGHEPTVFKNDLCHDDHINFRTAALLVLKTIRLQRMVSQKDRKIIKHTQEFKDRIASYEEKAKQLAPEIDGRIKCLV